MSTRLEHVAIAVTDVERSKPLYCDLLGYRVLSETTTDQPHLKRIVFLEKGPERIELLEMRGDQWDPAPARRAAGLTHICFAVDDLDEEVGRFRGAGLRLTVPPQRTSVTLPSEEHWRRAVFQGPDGESIELRGP